MQRLALILLSILSLHAAQAVEPPKRVIFMVIDSLRHDHLGYSGYDKTTSPWLDGIAEKSIRFNLAISPSDGTVRSVPSYMTGKLFSKLFKEPISGHTIPETEKTLAEAFKEAGFATHGWHTNLNLRKGLGFDQGFDQYMDIFPFNTPYASLEEITAVVQEAYQPTGGPEFHYFHTMDVHMPFNVRMPYDHLFVPDELKPIELHPETSRWVREGDMRGVDQKGVVSTLPYWSENHDVGPKDIAFYEAQYNGEIRYTDDHLPALLEALGFDPDKDLLILTADHGEQFFEQDFKGHNRCTLMPELHVPLLFYYNGLSPATYDYPVSLLDLYPTLCDLFGFEKPEGLSGRSRLPELNGEAQDPQPVFAEGSDDRGPTGVVISNGQLYYLNTRIHAFLYPWRVWPVTEALFNIQDDPLCLVNLAGDDAAATDAMNALLREGNPRFAQCVPQLIRGNEALVPFGDALFVPASKDKSVWQFGGSGSANASGQDLKLDYYFANAKVTGPVAHPGQAHVLQIRYKLDSGVLLFVLHDEVKKQEFWRYECRKPRKDWNTLRVVVYPPSESVRLVIRMDSAGSATVDWPDLRHVEIPNVPMVASEGSEAGSSTGTEAMTEEERSRLDALGYL